MGREGSVAAARAKFSGGDAAAPPRLLLVDTAADATGALRRAALPSVTVIEWNSATQTLAELVASIASVRAERGAAFRSIAVANHGPAGPNGLWRWATDVAVAPADAEGAAAALAPVLAPLVAALQPGAFGESHVELLACRLAGFAPALVPALERQYEVDFRASTDVTGNAASGGNWKMETDGGYDAATAYFDRPRLERFLGTLRGEGALIGGMLGMGVDVMFGGTTGGAGGALGAYIGGQFDR